jgi:hypothetical protein
MSGRLSKDFVCNFFVHLFTKGGHLIAWPLHVSTAIISYLVQPFAFFFSLPSLDIPLSVVSSAKDGDGVQRRHSFPTMVFGSLLSLVRSRVYHVFAIYPKPSLASVHMQFHLIPCT